MQRTVLINIVGLTPRLMEFAPNLKKFAGSGAVADLKPVIPAVTSCVQSSFLTGEPPSVHGIVANGWYFRDMSEIWLWRQSGALVEGEKIWEAAKKRNPEFTCAKLFWWFNMYSGADYSITPRPFYPADGRKIPEIYTHPAGLSDDLSESLGEFPLYDFWGPRAGIVSTDWIAAAARLTEEKYKPTLSLVYLPHLDYSLQKLGPAHEKIEQEVVQVDRVAGDLIRFYKDRGIKIIFISEYGIQAVNGAVPINRILRKAGYIAVRDELGLEKLDPGASTAFAVCDHQIAHVYIRDPSKVGEIRKLFDGDTGIDMVLDEKTKKDFGLDHERSGELVLLAKPDKWFSYYYWMDDKKAPDFARTVDIHRKPGFDPVELFIDPQIRFPALKTAWILAKKKLGFRYLMDLTPLDASLVKGSHGVATPDGEGPVVISESSLPRSVDARDIKKLILEAIFDYGVSC